MLVVTRKPDQSILVGDLVEIRVVEVLSIGVILEVQAAADVAVEWHTRSGRFRHEWGDESRSLHIVLHPHGTIHLDRTVQITLVSVRTEKARLGVNAPRSVPVVRKEVQQSRKPE